MTYVQTQAAQAARFWEAAESRTKFVGGCKEWQGPLDADGYGHVSKTCFGENLVHRAAYRATFGEIPPEASVCHTCDNPPCFLTGHLVLGTHQQNIADRVAKGRSAHTLTEGVVRAIVDTYVSNLGVSQKEIAALFGVSKQQVNRIVLGRRWAHLWRT